MKKLLKSMALILALVMLLGITPLTALSEHANTEFSTQSSDTDDITADFECTSVLAHVRLIVAKPSGPILRSDVSLLTDLMFLSQDIASLAGIEHFAALERLLVVYGELTELDVSNNHALTTLLIAGNKLTTLDISQNTALRQLNLTGNQLTTLDVSNNTALEGLFVSNNQLTELDVSSNPALVVLYCYSNRLARLDLSNNTGL